MLLESSNLPLMSPCILTIHHIIRHIKIKGFNFLSQLVGTPDGEVPETLLVIVV